MLSAKSIIPKGIKELYGYRVVLFIPLLCFFLSSIAQDNSPYSRYGIGDIVPSTNITGRGMGGISAAYTDIISVNLNNPATFASFQTIKEQNKKKIASGRPVLDIGVNIENRTLRDNKNTAKFTTSNLLFSYLQLGIPINKNWGIGLGIRPLSRISYKISRNEYLIDPQTQLPIDSANTLYDGDGGTYLPSIGTGYKYKNFSIGFNVGYLFGKKIYSTKRGFYSDTIEYYQSNHENKTTFGNISFNAGMQYKIELEKEKSLTLGAYGNPGQKLNASQDIIRETYVRDVIQGNVRLDSVSEQRNIKGTLSYPSSFGLGFIIEKIEDTKAKKAGWLLGMDFVKTNWSKYLFYGKSDSVRNSWELRIGGQIQPVLEKNFFSKISYRAGFFIGPDYVKVNKKLPVYGITFSSVCVRCCQIRYFSWL